MSRSAPATAKNSKSSVEERPSVAVWSPFLFSLLALVAFRPVAYEGTWWELSRGRAVLQGSLGPSRTLLVADEALETDWLGGVPFYVLFQLLGAAGLMLLRIAAVGLIAVVTLQLQGSRVAGRFPLSQWLWCWLIVAALSPALQPSPEFWDVLGLISVFCCGRLPSTIRFRFQTTVVFAATVLWANLGPRFGIAPVAFFSGWMLRPHEPAKSTSASATELLRAGLVILLAGCLTPRGWLGWVDTLRVLGPEFESLDWNQVASWAAAEWLAALGWLVALIWPSQSLRTRCGLLVAALTTGVLVALNPNNLIVTGGWCWIAVTVGIRGEAQRRMQGDVRQEKSDPDSATAIVHDRIGSFTQSLRERWQRSNVFRRTRPAIVVVFVTLSLWGGAVTIGGTEQMGWGLHSDLDDRVFRLVLSKMSLKGIPWSDRLSGIGMWCWVTEGKFPVYDAPHRAILGGRATKLRQLADDLRDFRQFRYHREDGTEGGWWLALNQEDISLLLVPADDLSMLRSLATTIWQPAMLDSPVLVYARAGSEIGQEMLLRTVQQRDFLEYGPWQFTGPLSSRSSFDRDRWGWSVPSDSRAIALRQARVFRALGLPMAASRVLTFLRYELPSRSVFRETCDLQREVAHHEQIAAGSTASLRVAVIASLTSGKLSDQVPSFQDAEVAPVLPNMRESAAAYVKGDLEAALSRLKDGESDDERLGHALLLWESGDPGPAKEYLEELAQSATTASVRNLARTWLRELEPDTVKDREMDAGHRPERVP